MPVEWLTNAGVELCPDSGERPGWIRIPYRNVRGMWGYRYRNPYPRDSKDRYWNPAGQAAHLYNPFGAGPGSDEVWIAEGEMDTLVLAGHDVNAVGIPGTGSTDHLFKKSWVHLFRGAEIHIIMDGDEQGREAASRLRHGFDMSGLNAYIVDVPNGLDVNDWYVEDPDGLRQVLKTRR